MTTFIVRPTFWHKAANHWILRNSADVNGGMLRVCAVFHPLRFREATHVLCLMVLGFVLSVLTHFAVMEHAKLEQIDFGATVHTSFDELKPIHISF